MIKSGTWWVESKTDPRWNGDGIGKVGGLVIPEKAKQHIKKMQKQLGEEPPEDLEVGYLTSSPP